MSLKKLFPYDLFLKILLSISFLFFLQIIFSCKSGEKNNATTLDEEQGEDSDMLEELESSAESEEGQENNKYDDNEDSNVVTPEQKNSGNIKNKNSENDDYNYYDDEEDDEEDDDNDKPSSSKKEDDEDYDDDYDDDEEVYDEDEEEYVRDFVNPATIKFEAAIGEDDIKIYTCNEDDEQKALTVKDIKLKGVSILPGEYKEWLNCEYEDRIKRLGRLGDDHMKNLFSGSQYPGQLIFTSEKGEAVIFKVKNYPIKEISSPRSLKRKSALANRVAHAAKRNGQVIQENGSYKSVAVLTFLRDRKNAVVRPYKDAELKINMKGAGKIPKFRSRRRRSWDDEGDDSDQKNRDSICNNMEGVTPDNTLLELVKVNVVRVEEGKESEFPIRNGLQEIDLDKLMGFDTTIKDLDGNIEQPGNAKVYYKTIAEYKWIGPIGDIDRNEDYKIGKKNNSDTLGVFRKSVRKKINKKLKNKMIFVSKKHCDLRKRITHDFEYSECDSCDRPISEYFIFWRLIVGGKCVGVVSPEERTSKIIKRVFGWEKIKRSMSKKSKRLPPE